LGEQRYIAFSHQSGGLTLAEGGKAATLCVDSQDWPGVVRAAGDLQADLERVTKAKPALENAVPARADEIVIIGTIGHSPLIDRLVSAGKLDVVAVRGKWEAWISQVVVHPAPGIERALVITGSDKRGTIYGIYDLSEQIGVSPWYWWGDVTPERRDALFVKGGRVVHGSPAVKYRGIFLNDEAPDLTNWVRAKFGDAAPSENPPIPKGIANYNSEFYRRLFEVILRLRGNYLWPAMWNNAFNEDDPKNAPLADEYGIVMGTSHQEPMQRAQKEWDRRFLSSIGAWNYAKGPEVLESFWREGVRRNKAFENLVTIGLRGANDTEMAPGGPEANRALLEKIVDVQRGILREEINSDITKVPQVWCLYKEVMDYYTSGMRVPDDVTLLWAEDNWGNLRRVPTAEERKRSGGAGIYYHFDYHGGPRSYQWLNTSPIPKIWEQMSLAAKYGADRVWIVNVGHFKGYEIPTEFFLNLAWNPGHWTHDNLREFTRQWAAREFGTEHASEIAEIVEKYPKFNARRKPEMLAPTTYSLTDYREAETVVADYNALSAKAEEIYKTIPEAKRDAYDQLVLFPTKASALVNELYLAAGKNQLYAKQARASANDQAVETQRLFQADLDLMASFNHDFAGGRWEHFMDQAHLGYTTWRDPPKNSLDAIKLSSVIAPDAASLGVAVEGSELAWPEAKADAVLPRFDAFSRQRHYLEVFNKGKTSFDFTAIATESWITLSETQGSLGKDQRLWVSIDWSHVPKGLATGSIKLAGANGAVTVKVEAFSPAEPKREMLHGFVESQGFISIEAEHYSKVTADGEYRWVRITDYGRTLSGMQADAPVDAQPLIPKGASPHLEYRLYLFSSGPVEITAITAPTMNFIPDRPVRYAVSLDDEAPQIVTLVPADYRVQNGNPAWEKSVADNAHTVTSKHTIEKPGYHTLKIWMVDPEVVIQKILVNLGGLKPSYLGPPESYRGAEVGRKGPKNE
jgi:hypothetical protein